MAGHANKREENYEIKYLRKVLTQVDKRVNVPETLSGDALRSLLDGVEPYAARVNSARRPWLTLQSGIAYAAAFALVAALFYSTGLYRPDVISGGIEIAADTQTGSKPAEVSAQAGHGAEALLLVDGVEEDADETADVVEAADYSVADEIVPFSEPVPASAEEARPTVAPNLGIGGGTSSLIFERGGYFYYQRANEAEDPYRSTPVSLEIVSGETLEITAQTDISLSEDAKSFAFGDGIVFAGTDASGETALYQCDISSPEEIVVGTLFVQEGVFAGAGEYDGMLRVASVAAINDPDAELLPNGTSGGVCVITVFDPATGNSVTKRFAGANGTVLLDDFGAHINYTGTDGSGVIRDYTARILVDGMDISLDTSD